MRGNFVVSFVVTALIKVDHSQSRQSNSFYSLIASFGLVDCRVDRMVEPSDTVRVFVCMHTYWT